MSGQIGNWRARPWGRPWLAVPGIVATADAIKEIGLSRGSCFGPCPVYSIQLSRSGEARFVGTEFVDLIGIHQGAIAPEDFSLLALAICHLGFDTFDPLYAVNHTDAATTTTWTRRTDRVIKVQDYGGAGPKRLRAVEKLIDAAASELRWTPGGAQIGPVDGRVSDLQRQVLTLDTRDAPDDPDGLPVLEATKNGTAVGGNSTDVGKSSGNPDDDSIAGDLKPRAEWQGLLLRHPRLGRPSDSLRPSLGFLKVLRVLDVRAGGGPRTVSKRDARRDWHTRSVQLDEVVAQRGVALVAPAKALLEPRS